MIVEWKEFIKGYYRVSNTGIIESVERFVDNGRGTKSFRQGVIMTQTLNPKGYPTVTLRVNNVKQTPVVHRIVALNFVPNPLGLPQVNHIDGIKENNYYTNLEWVTNSSNMLHAYSLGLNSKVGELNSATNLTEQDIKDIRGLQGKVSGIVLGKRYEIGKSAIYKIWNRETWKHIE